MTLMRSLDLKMKIIQNLLEILSTDKYESLLEALGNLSIIDRKFLPVLTNIKKDMGYFNIRFGENSPTEVKKFTSVRAALEFFDQNKNASGGILSSSNEIAGHQVVFFAVLADGSKPKYTVSIDISFIEKVLKPDDLDLGEIKTLMRWHGSTVSSSGIISTKTYKSNEINKILNMIFKLLKKQKENPMFTIIYSDKERFETRSKRYETRKGKVPLPSEIPNFTQYARDLKADLETRLDKFKSNKAVKYDSPEELIQGILESGFLDKLSFGGFVYDYSSDNFNISSLRGKGDPHWHQRSYIKYKINRDTNEYRTTLKKWYKDHETEEYGNIKPTIPETLMIYFELKGGSIVPAKLEYENFVF